jgi:hypothetical protein
MLPSAVAGIVALVSRPFLQHSFAADSIGVAEKRTSEAVCMGYSPGPPAH